MTTRTATVPQPTLAGRYRLRRRLATGALADVWSADDLRLERPVAVKWYRDDHEARVSHERELQLLAGLSHPAIVRLFDAGRRAGRPFVVVERIRGKTLRERIAVGPSEPEVVRAMGIALADALDHAHNAGVVHRDVKPANILIDETGLPHLADFGIAGTDEAAGDGTLLWGTPGYAAPEQLVGDRVGPAADVYALALVLLEALTGERAAAGNPLAAAVARVRGTPALPDGLPEPLARLLRDMLQRAPAKRPTAAEVATRLGAMGTLQATPERAAARRLPASEARRLVAAVMAVAALFAALAVLPYTRTSAQADDPTVAEKEQLVEAASRRTQERAVTRSDVRSGGRLLPAAARGARGGLRAGERLREPLSEPLR
ncbi:MAG: serine/threonine-protein kinase [Egibacteraceae bacterium]